MKDRVSRPSYADMSPREAAEEMATFVRSRHPDAEAGDLTAAAAYLVFSELRAANDEDFARSVVGTLHRAVELIHPSPEVPSRRWDVDDLGGADSVSDRTIIGGGRG